MTEIPSLMNVPPAAGPVTAYATSSQASHWRFSPPQLARIRAQTNESTIERLKSAWDEDVALATAAGAVPDDSVSQKPFLNVEEETTLIRFYLLKVGGIVRAFGLPEVVEARTTTYIKRFYLRHSCMDHHPKNIMLTCMFLASKSSNYFISLAHFSKKASGSNATPEDVEATKKTIIGLEFFVSQALGFEYATHGAERALRGLFLNFQDSATSSEVATLRQVAILARSNVSYSRLSDAEFFYTPAQIAMASARMVDGGRPLVASLLDEKEAQARQTKKAEKAKRETWRAEDKERRAKLAPSPRPPNKQSNGSAAPGSNTIGVTGDKGSEVVDEDISDDQIAAAPLGMERTALESLLDDIEALVRPQVAMTGKTSEELQSVKDIDRRLKICQSPAKDPQSHLYRARQREAETVAAEKRALAEEKKGTTKNPFADSGGEGGLFGPELKRRKVETEKNANGANGSAPLDTQPAMSNDDDD